MNLLTLKYFQTVAQLEHMTKSAEALQIPQPALSKMIASLETELNTKLFDRTGKYIRLNENGRVFLKKVNIALTALEDGKQELLDLTGEDKGFIELLVIVGSHLLPDILATFRVEYPNVHFRLVQHSPYSITRSEFDLCISAHPIPGTESVNLLTEDICVAVPSDHRLASRQSIRLIELAEESFISLKKGQSLRETTDTFCRQAGFTPRVIFESDDPATVRGLIRAGQGIAFIPSLTWGGSTGPSTVLLPLDEPDCKRFIRLCWPKDKYLTNTSSLFLEFCKDFFSMLSKRKIQKENSTTR